MTVWDEVTKSISFWMAWFFCQFQFLFYTHIQKHHSEQLFYTVPYLLTTWRYSFIAIFALCLIQGVDHLTNSDYPGMFKSVPRRMIFGLVIVVQGLWYFFQFRSMVHFKSGFSSLGLYVIEWETLNILSEWDQSQRPEKFN